MTDKKEHIPGCEALGGYGHGIGPCSCREAQPEALRVRKYIDRRRASRGLSRDHIHGFDVGDEAEALLLTSDLEAILGRIAFLEAQLSARQAAPDGWQPIETAPRDGERILLSGPTGRISVGFYEKIDGSWFWPLGLAQPTHWQPLPATPGSSRTGRNDQAQMAITQNLPDR
ncbi:hypothetical protein [Comamonas sp. MYb396]|uniref:hypothetical protein n=1 Tax=Comamonas sp. MYb396 TaxID=2745302 RepID=UPI0030B6711A